MEPVTRWWLRLAAATSATAVAAIATMWLVPTAAWAQGGPAVALVGDEVARQPRRLGLGAPGACCCLFVVLVIVLIVMMVRRRRQAPPPPPPPPPQ